jgi:ATP-binding cassette subfamily G (WHITE) protein 2 (PDR)
MVHRFYTISMAWYTAVRCCWFSADPEVVAQLCSKP